MIIYNNDSSRFVRVYLFVVGYLDIKTVLYHTII